MNRFYTDKQSTLIYNLKNLTISNCNSAECFNGWDIKTNSPCDCRKVFIYLKELVYARIPVEYWHLEMKNLRIEPPHIKLLFRKYINNFDLALSKGLSLGFIGNNGVGKTFLLCELGKQSILREINVLYITAQEYVKYEMESNETDLLRLEEADVILLDEIDKPYRKTGSNYVVTRLEGFFRDKLPKNRVIHIATNWNEKRLEKELGSSIYSILLRKIKLLHILGEDMSMKLNEKWEERLMEEEIDYMNSYFIKIARQMKRFKIEK